MTSWHRSPLIRSFKHISMWRATGGGRRRCRKSPHHDNFSIAVNARVDLLEAIGQRDVGIDALFQDDDGAVSDPAAGRGRLKRARAETFAVGRVEKDEVERYKHTCRAELSGIAPPELSDAGKAKRFDVAADGGTRLGALLDEQAEARTARQRLEPERARAGKQIEHAGVFEDDAGSAVLQHIEQRLAHFVRCRPR